jgi:hypothetical protein
VIYHHVLPFLQKEVLENVVKGLIMLEVQSPQNLPKELPIYSLPKTPYIIILPLPKWILKIWEKVLM